MVESNSVAVKCTAGQTAMGWHTVVMWQRTKHQANLIRQYPLVQSLIHGIEGGPIADFSALSDLRNRNRISHLGSVDAGTKEAL